MSNRVPSQLLRPGVEAFYVNRIRHLVFRSRVFWSRASSNGGEGLAIPTWVRPYAARRWLQFDHSDRDNLRDLFNFGPVSDELIRLLVRNEAPPFFIHHLALAHPGRVKLRASFGSYHWTALMPHRSTSWALQHAFPKAASVLPDPYAAWWRCTIEEAMSLVEADGSSCHPARL